MIFNDVTYGVAEFFCLTFLFICCEPLVCCFIGEVLFNCHLYSIVLCDDGGPYIFFTLGDNMLSILRDV